jgi:anti-sigma regulatory factor (Ser/Thr protein kinase)
MSHMIAPQPEAGRYTRLETPEPFGECEEGREPAFECWLPADARAVPMARHQVWPVWRCLGASDEECLELDLALGEALANAVSHGADGAGDALAHIHLSLWTYNDAMITMVRDFGPGFDPPIPPYTMPTAGIDTLSGRGLPLMQMLTDALLISRADPHCGGASVFLVKRLRSKNGQELSALRS